MPYLPKRLLDLGPRRIIPTSESAETPGQDQGAFSASENAQCDPVLIETNVISSEETKYVALSYCWGSSAAPLKTEINSLEMRRRGIPVDTMPSCFQDAIEVVRALGLRYVWIDSLCIIQDDDLDWQKESGSMCDTFGNAYITLGIASTSSCQEKFLQNLPERFDVPFRLKLDQTVSGAYSIQASPQNSFYYTRSMDPLEWDLLDSQWNGRGWVWQEQNVSPSLLVWGRSMFHLRGKRIESENGTVTVSKHFGSTFYANMTEQELEEWWYDTLIRDYSRRKLSVRRDRLPAISGLAKRVGKVLPASYKAGHWYSKETFWWSLLWEVRYHRPEFEELLEDLTLGDRYSAPSWSWASRTQQVSWGQLSFHVKMHDAINIAEIIDCQVSSDSVDLTGAVREGRLVVKGKLKQVPVPLSSGDFHDYRVDQLGEAYWEIHFPGVTCVCCTLDWQYSLQRGKDPGSLGSPLRMLPFLLTGRSRLITGLLLFPQANNFVRVGTFKAWIGLDCDMVHNNVFTTTGYQEITII